MELAFQFQDLIGPVSQPLGRTRSCSHHVAIRTECGHGINSLDGGLGDGSWTVLRSKCSRIADLLA
ncbi:hypothetical protein [Pseudomonas phage PIP]|nr:hypothetical protein [Pseudomonas phage PIP]